MIDEDPNPVRRAMALPDRLWRHAIATGAGPAAEARVCRSTGLQPEDFVEANAHDLRYVRKVAAGIAVDEKAILDRASTLVDRRWTDIENLAAEFAERWPITDVEGFHIVEIPGSELVGIIPPGALYPDLAAPDLKIPDDVLAAIGELIALSATPAAIDRPRNATRADTDGSGRPSQNT